MAEAERLSALRLRKTLPSEQERHGRNFAEIIELYEKQMLLSWISIRSCHRQIELNNILDIFNCMINIGEIWYVYPKLAC